MAQAARFTEQVTALVTDGHRQGITDLADVDKVTKGDVIRALFTIALPHLEEMSPAERRALYMAIRFDSEELTEATPAGASRP